MPHAKLIHFHLDNAEAFWTMATDNHPLLHLFMMRNCEPKQSRIWIRHKSALKQLPKTPEFKLNSPNLQKQDYRVDVDSAAHPSLLLRWFVVYSKSLPVTWLCDSSALEVFVSVCVFWGQFLSAQHFLGCCSYLLAAFVACGPAKLQKREIRPSTTGEHEIPTSFLSLHELQNTIRGQKPGSVLAVLSWRYLPALCSQWSLLSLSTAASLKATVQRSLNQKQGALISTVQSWYLLHPL